MRLRYLQALRAVMETGTVTGAAQRLHRTQPQVSRLIANLEQELGFKIFVRHKRRLTPTKEGRLFYNQIERALSEFDGISNIIQEIRKKDEPRLRIMAQSFLMQSLVPDALATMIAIEPRLRYSLDVVSRLEVRNWFNGREVDVGLAALPLESDPTVRTQPFATARMVAILPPGHHLAGKHVLDARDIADEPFIGLKPYTLLRKEIDRHFSELGLHLNIRCEASSGIAVCQLVAQGLGVSIEDPLLARKFVSQGLIIREWQPSFSVTYGFVFPAKQEHSALTLKFTEMVVQAAIRLDPEHVTLHGDTTSPPGAEQSPSSGSRVRLKTNRKDQR